MRLKISWHDNEYSLVWRFRKQTIMKHSPRTGFFYPCGKARGILVMNITWHGSIWYHKPEDCLDWKDDLKDDT